MTRLFIGLIVLIFFFAMIVVQADLSDKSTISCKRNPSPFNINCIVDNLNKKADHE